MYQRIQAAKDLPRDDALVELDSIEKQIHENIKDIQKDIFVHVANLDKESCKNIHKMLLNEVERVRNKILNNK